VKNPKKSWDEIRAEVKAISASYDADIANIERMLERSPALRGKWGDRQQMAIVSGELYDHDAGKLRVTFIGDDGPRGHVTVTDVAAAAKRIRESMEPPFVSMNDDDVIAWTSTEQFVVGSKVVAFMQAENTLRYMSSQARQPYEKIAPIIHRANDVLYHARQSGDHDKMDEAIGMLTRELAHFPTPNPRIAGFVANPPWVTKALADHFELLEGLDIPRRWMPQLVNVRASGTKSVLASLIEFGCGSYGCVLATLDPATVLKVTSDEFEAEFAGKIANEIPPVCVDYKLVVRLAAKREGRAVHLLWREAAEEVGNMVGWLRDQDREVDAEMAENYIQDLHRIGQLAFDAVINDTSEAPQRLIAYKAICANMAESTVPEIRSIGAGLLESWERKRVLFGDLHDGNFGMVTRAGRKSWVITDPGNVIEVRGR
jgi:hypothetical protein